MSVATNAGWMETTLILPLSAPAIDSVNLQRQPVREREVPAKPRIDKSNAKLDLSGALLCTWQQRQAPG